MKRIRKCRITESEEKKGVLYECCCVDCGKEKYNRTPERGITAIEGVCKFCGKKKFLILAGDWWTAESEGGES